MRILIASRYVDPFPSSSNKNVYLQANYLKHKLEIDCEILTWPSNDQWTGDCPDGSPSRLIHQERNGILYHIFSAPSDWDEIGAGNSLSDRSWAQAKQYAQRILQELTPDIVHLHHRHGFWWILEAAQDLGIPTIYTSHDWGLACLRTTLVQGNGKLCNGITSVEKCSKCIKEGRRSFLGKINECVVELPGISFLFEVLSTVPFLSRKFHKYKLVKRRATSRVISYLYRAQNVLSNLNSCIVPSEYGSVFFQRLGCSKDKISIMPWYSNSQQIRELSYSKRSDELTLTYVGRLSPEKGIAWTLEHLAKISFSFPLHIRIAGAIDSPFAKTLFQSYSQSCGVHRITWLGWASSSDIYLSTDAILIPSQWIDNTPLTLVESFSHRLPVLATDIPTIREYVTEDENGFLFEINNSFAFQQSINRLRLRLQKTSSYPIDFPHVDSLDQYMSKVLKIYNQCLS